MSFTNEDSLRHSYKDGRKADYLVFIINEPKQVVKLRIAIEREFGRRMRDQTWQEFPNVYYLFENQIIAIFNMYKKRQI